MIVNILFTFIKKSVKITFMINLLWRHHEKDAHGGSFSASND